MEKSHTLKGNNFVFFKKVQLGAINLMWNQPKFGMDFEKLVNLL